MVELLHDMTPVIEIHETYVKQTCRNHCAIGGPNGRQILTLPVTRPNGNRTMIKEIRIDNRQPWQRIHWRSIVTAYSNAPFFLYYKDDLEPFYSRPWEFLIEFNTALLSRLLEVIRIPRPITYTGHFHHELLRTGQLDPVSKKNLFSNTPYLQPFSPVNGFLANLSVIDALFNLGPETREYLEKQ